MRRFDLTAPAPPPALPRPLVAGLVVLGAMVLGSCGLLSAEPGACVSDVAEFQHIGDQVYCYTGWDRNECEAYDDEQVNGVGWSFFEGQTCADRGLEDGSNDWP